MRSPCRALLAITLALAAVTASAAVEPGDPPGNMAVEESLQDIAEALRQLVAEQRILLEMRRLELAERRLGPQQDELRRARDEVRAIGEEIARMEGIAESFRHEISEEVTLGTDPAGARAELDRLETMIEVERERLESAERRVQDAEADLDLARRQVERIEAALEERLDALDG